MHKKFKMTLATAAFCLVAPLFGGCAPATKATRAGAEAGAEVSSQPTVGPADNEEVVRPGAVDSVDGEIAFESTSSGLRYRVLRASEGRKPTASDSVEVHYKGWLDDGTIFDSSYRRGETISFPLNQVIQGWTEGMQLVGEGGMIELEIPYQLGYGERGTQGIPPRAQLHFVVELISVQ